MLSRTLETATRNNSLLWSLSNSNKSNSNQFRYSRISLFIRILTSSSTLSKRLERGFLLNSNKSFSSHILSISRTNKMWLWSNQFRACSKNNSWLIILINSSFSCRSSCSSKLCMTSNSSYTFSSSIKSSSSSLTFSSSRFCCSRSLTRVSSSSINRSRAFRSNKSLKSLPLSR